MISRWDAVVNAIAHDVDIQYVAVIHFRCEACRCREFHLQGIESQTENGVIYRRFLYECTRCGQVEATSTKTMIVTMGRSV